MRIITPIALYAALAVVSCLPNFSFADPGDDDEVVGADAPVAAPMNLDDAAALAEAPSLDSLLESVRAQFTAPADAPRYPHVLAPNLRRAEDMNELGRLHDVITDNDTEIQSRLRWVLGNHGYEGMVELAKAIAVASGKDDPWRQVIAAVDDFQANSMERLQAKRLVVLWLKKEEALFPSNRVSSPLTLLTLTDMVQNPEMHRVLERVSEALKDAKPTTHHTVLDPVAQLLALAPYLPKLEEKKQMQVFAKAMELTAANTDLSELELLERYLLDTLQRVVCDSRLYTTLGTQHAFRVGLRYLKVTTKTKYIPKGMQGSILATATVLLKGVNERLTSSRDNKLDEWDYHWRTHADLRKTLSEMLTDHPSLLSNLNDFPEVRKAVTRQALREGCAAHVADPLSLLLTGGN